MAALAQDPSVAIQGPVLGFAEDAGGEVIRPMLGVWGASVLGPPLVLDTAIRHAVISPRQDYAVAIRGEDEAAVLIRFDPGGIAMRGLEGIRAGADRVAISPAGTAVVFYDDDAKWLQAIRTTAQASEIAMEWDVSDIAGQLQAVAIADDGLLALLTFVDGDYAALWSINGMGARSQLAVNRPSSAAFLTHRYDAIIGDDADQSIVLIRGLDAVPVRIPIASFGNGFDAISGVMASEDGNRIFITSTTSKQITVVDLTTGLSSRISCHCQAAGLTRMIGRDVFRLHLPAGTPVTLLDASIPEPRIMIIPPAHFDPPSSEGPQ